LPLFPVDFVQNDYSLLDTGQRGDCRLAREKIKRVTVSREDIMGMNLHCTAEHKPNEAMPFVVTTREVALTDSTLTD
jgi:hypothetical protein